MKQKKNTFLTRMMNKCISVDYYVIPIVFFLLVSFAFGLYYTNVYVTDLVYIYEGNPHPYDTVSNLPAVFWGYMGGGRVANFFLYILQGLFDHIGVNAFAHAWILRVITFATCAIVLSALYFLYKFFLTKEFLPILAGCILIGFINPANTEGFLFAGIGQEFGMLMGAIALVFWKKKRYLISILFVFLSVSTYQSLYSFFVAYVILYIFLETKGELAKECIREYFRAAICVIIPLLITFLLPMIGGLNGSDVPKDTSIPLQNGYDLPYHIEKMKGAFLGTINDAYGFAPMYFIKRVLLIMLIVTIIVLLIRKEWKHILLYVILTTILLFSPFAFGLVSDSPQFWSRTLVPFYMSLGCIFMMSSCYIVKFGEAEGLVWQIAQIVLLGIIAIFLIVMMYGAQLGISDVLTTNKVEIQTCREVEESIKEYEEETGNEITDIKIAHFREGRAAFDSTYCNIGYTTYYGNHSVLTAEWPEVSLLNMVTGENYKRLDASEEEAEEHFGWIEDKADSLRYFKPEEQLAFDGNTMYWMLY